MWILQHISLLHFHFFLFLVGLVSATAEPIRYTLGYTPISTNSRPISFAVLLGTPIVSESPSGVENGTPQWIWSLDTYSAPRKEGAEWARIGFLDSSGKEFIGSTTLAHVAALKKPTLHASEFYLQLDSNGSPKSVTLRATQDSEQKAASKDVGQPRVLVMTSAPEPQPLLNKPVALNAEGKVEQAPKEKTLLQRYWWVGAIFLAMTLMGGGDGK